MATWILLGTPIAIYSPTKESAMCNIFQILRGDAGHILLDSILTNGVYGRAFIYTCIYFGGIWSMVLYNMAAGILRAYGDSKRPL